MNIFAPNWEPADSYGRLAGELASHLETAKHPVNRIGLHGSSGVLKKGGGFLLGYPTLHHLYPPLAQIGTRIAVTMFESTRIPQEWVEPLNKCDAVVVPAQFLHSVFRECGVTVPIHVVPLGISEAFFQVARRDSERAPFTFLSIADRGYRKGGLNALQAFIAAFGDDMNYKLILKCRELPFRFNNPNVEVIRENLTDEGMANLYQSAHAMIFATKGEGFGFPPREFAATGGVALATNWGGTADDLQHWGISIPHAERLAWRYQDDWYGKLGMWAEPDHDALVEMLRYVKQHYDAYSQFAIRAAGYVRTHYRWSMFGQRMLSIWEHYTEERHDHTDRHANGSAAQAT